MNSPKNRLLLGAVVFTIIALMAWDQFISYLKHSPHGGLAFLLVAVAVFFTIVAVVLWILWKR